MCNQLLSCKAELAIGGVASTGTPLDFFRREWSDAGELAHRRPFHSTGAGDRHLGGNQRVEGSVAPAGPVTVHESATVPVKPPLGAMVIVEVPVAPGEAMLTAVLLSAKAGTAFTITGTI